MDQHDELPRLIDRCCDESATADDVDRLEGALRGDRDALSKYVEYVGLHTALDWLITSKEALCEVVGVRAEAPSRWPDKSRRYAAFALCASILVAFGLGLTGFWSTPPEDSGPSALVSWNSDEASWVVLRSSERPDGFRPEIFAGETIHLTGGQIGMRFGDGADVALTGPAVLQVLGPDRALAVRGKLTAVVNEQAIGFAVDTPRAQVVDLGTRFGLEVDDRGGTDVVVFEGEVDVAYGSAGSESNDWQRRVMRMGEGVRVDDSGAARRIVSIHSDRFASAQGARPPHPFNPLITEVRDNIRGQDSWNYYEIVHGGMAEDALAYVDRIGHEWNGISEAGMPSYLVGGDYVKMFNNDKMAGDFEVEVYLQQPSKLYILFDDRVPPPRWLTSDFRDTGDDIGLDNGPFQNMTNKRINEEHESGVGPGVSVDDKLSIWVRVVEAPTTLRLGSTETETNRLNMYGIVATPLVH